MRIVYAQTSKRFLNFQNEFLIAGWHIFQVQLSFWKVCAATIRTQKSKTMKKSGNWRRRIGLRDPYLSKSCGETGNSIKAWNTLKIKKKKRQTKTRSLPYFLITFFLKCTQYFQLTIFLLLWLYLIGWKDVLLFSKFNEEESQHRLPLATL